MDSPPVKALFVYNSNPAAVAPDHNRVVRGLKRADLFTVVHEQFLTDTTDYADIVLPATTFFEHKDLQTSYGTYFLQISNRAIEPRGECKSNVELFRLLALRMGFEDECFAEPVDAMIDQALHGGHPWLKGIDRARLEQEGHVRLNFPTAPASEPTVGTNGWFLPFAEGKFATTSGKAELCSSELAAQGLDPVASFVPAEESRHGLSNGGGGDRQYPLELLARKADNFLNSTFCNLPATRAMESPELLEISGADAQARGIQDGDRVRVFNSRGEVWLSARVQPHNGNVTLATVQPGTVAARLNWAKLSPQGRNINALTSQRLTDLGEAATFYSTLVEVERAE
jgi:anaerobic selenocysteine-containing dehydrogenase